MTKLVIVAIECTAAQRRGGPPGKAPVPHVVVPEIFAGTLVGPMPPPERA